MNTAVGWHGYRAGADGWILHAIRLGRRVAPRRPGRWSFRRARMSRSRRNRRRAAVAPARHLVLVVLHQPAHPDHLHVDRHRPPVVGHRVPGRLVIRRRAPLVLRVRQRPQPLVEVDLLGRGIDVAVQTACDSTLSLTHRSVRRWPSVTGSPCRRGLGQVTACGAGTAQIIGRLTQIAGARRGHRALCDDLRPMSDEAQEHPGAGPAATAAADRRQPADPGHHRPGRCRPREVHPAGRPRRHRGEDGLAGAAGDRQHLGDHAQPGRAAPAAAAAARRGG